MKVQVSMQTGNKMAKVKTSMSLLCDLPNKTTIYCLPLTTVMKAFHLDLDDAIAIESAELKKYQWGLYQKSPRI